MSFRIWAYKNFCYTSIVLLWQISVSTNELCVVRHRDSARSTITPYRSNCPSNCVLPLLHHTRQLILMRVTECHQLTGGVICWIYFKRTRYAGQLHWTAKVLITRRRDRGITLMRRSVTVIMITKYYISR